MATYINFIQNDVSKIEETEKILSAFVFDDGSSLKLWSQEDIDIENEKNKTNGHGYPDFLQLGEAQFQLSLSSEDNIRMFILAMEAATKRCGVIINKIPPNIEDYISKKSLLRFYNYSLYQENKEFLESETAHIKALEKKDKKLMVVF